VGKLGTFNSKGFEVIKFRFSDRQVASGQNLCAKRDVVLDTILSPMVFLTLTR